MDSSANIFRLLQPEQQQQTSSSAIISSQSSSSPSSSRYDRKNLKDAMKMRGYPYEYQQQQQQQRCGGSDCSSQSSVSLALLNYDNCNDYDDNENDESDDEVSRLFTSAMGSQVSCFSGSRGGQNPPGDDYYDATDESIYATPAALLWNVDRTNPSHVSNPDHVTSANWKPEDVIIDVESSYVGPSASATDRLIAALESLRMTILESRAGRRGLGRNSSQKTGGRKVARLGAGAGGGDNGSHGNDRRRGSSHEPGVTSACHSHNNKDNKTKDSEFTDANDEFPFRRPNGILGELKDEKSKARRERVIVELRVVFLKIGEIDTLKEQYSADTYIQAKWREPSLDGKSPEELKRVDLSRCWNPLLYIDNILSETKEATWFSTMTNCRDEVFVCERRRVRGVFMENLELNDFPLDVQDLTVTITSERPDTELDIVPDEEDMSGINIQTFVDQQEWKLHEHIEVSRKVMTQEYSSSSRCHPALSVTCRAARRPGYFYWNVFLVMFFISALSFATFSVAPELPQNRLQLSFTLLLTSVAFKFVINQSLPKISYLTYMDKYVLLSLVILCVVCIWHALVIVFAPYGLDFMARVEHDVFIGFGVAYIVTHLVFIFWLYFDACKRRRLMKRKDKEYRDFLSKKKEWLERSKEFIPSSRRQSLHMLHPVHAL